MQERTILIIDDDRVIINLVRLVLKQMNIGNFVTANNGVEGLAAWQNNKDKIDLIITDLNMPRMNGDVLIQRIREQGPKVKILMMSGQYTEQEAIRHGADEFVSKADSNFVHLLEEKVRFLLSS